MHNHGTKRILWTVEYLQVLTVAHRSVDLSEACVGRVWLKTFQVHDKYVGPPEDCLAHATAVPGTAARVILLPLSISTSIIIAKRFIAQIIFDQLLQG